MKIQLKLNDLVEEIKKLKNVKYDYTEGKVKIYQIIANHLNNYNTMEVFTKNGKYVCQTKKVTMLKTVIITKEYSYLTPLLKYIMQFSEGGI